MKAFRQGFAMAGVLAASAALAAPAVAQTTRGPAPDAPRMMVLVFRGNEANVGVQAADAIRNRVGQDIPARNLWNIPKTDIEATLKASGYSTTEPLNANDAKALGTLMRADEFIEGTVTRAPGNVKIDGRLVLVRDPALVQPFAMAEGGNLNGAAAALSKEIKAARAQLDDERNCYRLSREGKFAEAIEAAKKGTVDYPKATISRVCQLRAMVEAKAAPAEVLVLANEILAIHSTNKVALANAADIYKAQGDQGKAVEAWTTLLATDPTNTRLVEQVVRELGQAGEVQSAKPIIERAVAENPGDPNLVGLAWTVMRAVRDWKPAIRYAEELVTLDTARADTLYFAQLAVAYANDSQPQKAAEALARGTAKFPSNAALQLNYARALRGAGQNQQAIQALGRALAADPKVTNGRLLMAQLYMDMTQPDSAIATLRSAAAAGDDAASLAQAALTFGNQAYRAANATKSRDDFMKAMPFLALSDSLNPTAAAKFLLGASAFSVGLSHATDAQNAVKEKQNGQACTSTRAAIDAFAITQANVPPGGATSPEAAGQIMGAVGQYTPVLENWRKQFCR